MGALDMFSSSTLNPSGVIDSWVVNDGQTPFIRRLTISCVANRTSRWQLQFEESARQLVGAKEGCDSRGHPRGNLLIAVVYIVGGVLDWPHCRPSN